MLSSYYHAVVSEYIIDTDTLEALEPEDLETRFTETLDSFIDAKNAGRDDEQEYLDFLVLKREIGRRETLKAMQDDEDEN